VLAGLFKTKNVDRLFLEKFITPKLKGPLHKITGKGRAKASRKSANAFGLDNLTKAANHATVVGSGVELDSGLDTIGVLADGGRARADGNVHVNGSEGTVSDGAAQRTGKSEARVEIKALGCLLLGALGHDSRSDRHCGGGDECTRHDMKEWVVDARCLRR
jgi:hypothetical protein